MEHIIRRGIVVQDRNEISEQFADSSHPLLLFVEVCLSDY